MTFEQVIKKIKSDTWWSEESPGNFQQLISAWRAFLLQSKLYGPKFLSICICLYRDDFVYEKTSESEKLAQFYKVRDIYIQNPDRIRRDFQAFLNARTAVISRGESEVKRIEKLSDADFAQAYKKYYQLQTDFFTRSVMPEGSDVYSDKHLLNDLLKFAKNKFDLTELSEAGIALSTQTVLSFMELERVEFLKGAISGKIDFGKFSRKYHWIQNNYLAHKYLTPAYFEKSYKELIKSKNKKQLQEELGRLRKKVRIQKLNQKKYASKFQFDRKMQKTLEFLRFLGKWIDDRKYGVLHGIYYIDAFVNEAAKRISINKDLLGYATPEELEGLILGKKIVTIDVLKSRRRQSVYVFMRDGKNFKELVLTGNNAAKIFNLFKTKQAQFVRGFVASAPVSKLTGRVQVVLNPHKEKFTPGRILVTTMTRPDFVPLMRKAAAIITDEGGITSHAAIVSRELKIPCIIGTKDGTKVLKTGDLVEVDTSKGIVTKLK